MSGVRPDSWMPLYWGDYRRDTAHLSAAEHGAYLLLIGHYWTTRCPLPDSDAQLARIAAMTPSEWRRARATVAAFFDVANGEWRHGRVDKELRRADEKYAKRANAANQRWANASSNALSNADAMHDPMQMQPQPQLQSKEVSELVSLAARGKTTPGRRGLEPAERRGVWASRIMDHLRRTLPTAAAEAIIADFLAGGEDGKRQFEAADAHLKARRANGAA